MALYQARNKSMGGSSKIAQLGKVLATRPLDLGSIPESHVIEGENRLPQAVIWPSHKHKGTHAPTQVHIKAHMKK